MASRGDYSVIQFCPDSGRFETANVGVALLCPDREFLDVRVSGDNARPKKFFGADAFDPKLLTLAKRSLAEQICRSGFRTREAFTRFCAMQADLLQMTVPQFCRVDADPAAALDRLYGKIVAVPPAAPPAPPFAAEVRAAFDAAGLLGERVLTEVPGPGAGVPPGKAVPLRVEERHGQARAAGPVPGVAAGAGRAAGVAAGHGGPERRPGRGPPPGPVRTARHRPVRRRRRGHPGRR